MDPNEALSQLRKAIKVANDEWTSERLTYDALWAVFEAAEALDEWISKGGFLPRDWDMNAREEA